MGWALGIAIYFANKRLTDKLTLTVFVALLLLFLSAGLFTGGCHNLEVELGTTKEIWRINGKFWDVNRLPMTVLKPFGYNDSRTVLEISCYWGWLALGALFHYRKYRRVPILINKRTSEEVTPFPTPQDSRNGNEAEGGSLEFAEGTLDGTAISDPL